MTGVIKKIADKKTEATRYNLIDGHSIFLLCLTAMDLPQCKKESIFFWKGCRHPLNLYISTTKSHCPSPLSSRTAMGLCGRVSLF